MNFRSVASRTTVTTALLGAALAFSAGPAAAAGSSTIVDATGAQRGTLSAAADLVVVCGWQANGAQVSVEYQFADGQVGKRIAPRGGCTVAKAEGSPIVAVRGLVDTFANDWHTV